MTPDQELYDAMYGLSESLGYETVEYIPDAVELGDLPSVYVGETLTQPLSTKDHVLGSVSVTVHVFGKRNQRKLVSERLTNIFNHASTIKKTDNFGWSFNGGRTMPQVVGEKQSDGIFLWHGYMTAEMRLTR